VIETGWSTDFQNLILAAALRGDLLREVPLDPELFRGGEKGGVAPTQQIAEILVAFYTKYARPPVLDEFRLLVDEAGRGRPERSELLQDTVAQIMVANLPEDSVFLRERIVRQLELRRFEQALFETAPMLSKPEQLEQAREIMVKAMEPIARGDDRPRTVEIFGQAEMRLEMWRQGEEYGERITTGFNMLDQALGGGPTRREVFYYLAPPKGAKTAALLHTAIAASNARFGVYMVTYEMQAMRMALRADRAISRQSRDEIRADYAILKNRLDAARTFGLGEITIDEHPTQSPLSIATARRRIQEIRRKGGKVDVVILDYLNIMGAAKEDREKRHELAKISREISQMAKDLDVLVWCAALVNRTAVNKSIIRKTDIAEAFEVIAVADGVVAICGTKKMVARSLRRFWVAAAREEADEIAGGDYKVDFARQILDPDTDREMEAIEAEEAAEAAAE
jgi:RecA/RadA recombinase